MSLDRIPSGFSDATTVDDVDLTNMTEEEKAEYFKQKEKRRKEREIRRRAKYGDKYDEIMKKREEYVYVSSVEVFGIDEGLNNALPNTKQSKQNMKTRKMCAYFEQWKDMQLYLNPHITSIRISLYYGMSFF